MPMADGSRYLPIVMLSAPIVNTPDISVPALFISQFSRIFLTVFKVILNNIFYQNVLN